MKSQLSDSFTQEFARDIDEGLSAKKKFLPSRYFYDAQGDKLFQQIMQLPEYYLTDCEYRIFKDQRAEILKAVNPTDELQLVELGAGDGYKTRLLLEYFLEQNVNFRYYPVDISADVLQILQTKLTGEFPKLQVQPINSEYFVALEELRNLRKGPLLILFLGSNIGNFTPERADSFFSRLNQLIKRGDQLLIGIDLKKDPRTILQAYNDSSGVTRQFNLNLLERINRDLGGNFDLQQWEHYPLYDPDSGEARSYLISKTEQTVFIEANNRSYSFQSQEPIRMEISRKYSLEEIDELAQRSGFRIKQHFTDPKDYFSDSLWITQS